LTEERQVTVNYATNGQSGNRPIGLYCTTIPRLAVRDLAAMKLASLLGMPESPDRSWSEAEWAALRQKVRERLQEQA
jgi:hypothetical protein